MFLGIRGQVDTLLLLLTDLSVTTSRRVGGGKMTEKSQRSESDTSFNPNNLQIMTGLSGSQGEGISQ